MPKNPFPAPLAGVALLFVFLIPLLSPPTWALVSPLQGDGTSILRTSEGRDYPVQLAGGDYYIGVASDRSTGVNATVANSSGVVVYKAATYWGVKRISLPAGGYTVHLAGVGAAVLARDFQNPGTSTIHVGKMATEFLLPQGRSELHISITMGTPATTRVDVYDAFMQARYGANFTNGISFTVSLPQDASDAAYLVLVPQGGNTNMTMTWGSVTPAAPLDTVLILGAIVGVPAVIIGVSVYLANLKKGRKSVGRGKPPRGDGKK